MTYIHAHLDPFFQLQLNSQLNLPLLPLHKSKQITALLPHYNRNHTLTLTPTFVSPLSLETLYL